MAGFSDQAKEVVDVEVIPPPAVMVVFGLGDEQLVVGDGSGRQRERVVIGLAPGSVRGRGLAGSCECLQVRLSPPAAHAILGACSELGGTVASLDDIWACPDYGSWA